MAIKLSSLDVRQILIQKEGRLRQLQFEMDLTKKTIKDLKQALPTLESAEAELAQAAAAQHHVEIAAAPVSSVATSAKRPGRKSGSTTAKKADAGQKRDRSQGYRLSESDEMVFAALRENGREMLKGELAQYLQEQKAAQGVTISAEDAELMVARSLQKLANRRSDILKMPYAGRGKLYALPNWVKRDKTIKPAHRYKQ